MECLRALDLRFVSEVEERRYKAAREGEMLRAVRRMALWCCTCTVVHGMSVLGASEYVLQVLLFQLGDVRTKIVLCQQLMWSLPCILVAGVITTRLGWGKFRRWNWEAVVLLIMVYGTVALIYGQTALLSRALGEDVMTVWGPSVKYGFEAWSLFNLNVVINVVLFFMPIRCNVSWVIPAIGSLAYFCSLQNYGFEQFARTFGIILLSYFAWCSSWRTERHVRTEWAAIREVEVSSTRLEEHRVTISNKVEEIDSKEREILEKDDLANSLLLVARALCDTMVVLDEHLCILSIEASDAILVEEGTVGATFTDLLTADDQSRFADCVSRARWSKLPELLPVTLQRQGASAEAQLLLVAQGHFRVQYILGVRVDGAGTSGGGGGSYFLEQNDERSTGRSPPAEDDVVSVLSGSGRLPGAVNDSQDRPCETEISTEQNQGAVTASGQVTASGFSLTVVPPAASDESTPVVPHEGSPAPMNPIDENAESDFGFGSPELKRCG